MGNKGHDPDLDKVKQLLTLVRDSCEEALNGKWDHRDNILKRCEEAFHPMIDDIEEAAKELGIELEPYEPDND